MLKVVIIFDKFNYPSTFINPFCFLFCMEKAIAKLIEMTGHKNVKLVSSGNAAILASLLIASKASSRKTILIPDQGGWISFRTYPIKFGFKTEEVKTDRGLIDLNDLKKKAKSAAAFLVTSFAGYYAEQSIKEIYEICRKNSCMLILDASGAVGYRRLCDGSNADIIVASFGRWKPVNLGTGGFISAKKAEHLEKAGDIFAAMKFSGDMNALLEKLNDAKKRIDFFMGTAEKIKKEMENEGLQVLHREKIGLNAVVGFKNKAQKEKITGYCSKNGYEYVICPKDIRVNENAISIEVKRLQKS